MKLILCFFVFLTQASWGAMTQNTALGFTFTQVNDPQMGSSWQDPDGNVWSLSQGRFQNIGESLHLDPTSNDRDIVDSEAVKVCQALGAILPSMKDYRALRRFFKNSLDFLTVFPGIEDYYWSSSTANRGGGYARYMQVRPLDAFGDLSNAQKLYGVQCLKRRLFP